MKSNMTSATLAAMASTFALAATTGAASAADTPDADPQAQAAAAPQADSRRAVRDKVTGQLRAPSSDETAAMQASEQAGRTTRGLPEPGAMSGPLRVVQHAGGMRSAVLGTGYLVTLKAQRRADGSLGIGHNQPGLDQPVSRELRPTE